MFRALEMVQLSVLVLERDTRVVLRALGRWGVMQLRRTGPGPETAPLAAADLSRELTRCDRVIAGAEALGNSLEIPIAPKPLTSLEMTLDKAEADLRAIEARAATVLESYRRLEARLTELDALWERISDYRGQDVPLDAPDRFAFLHFVTGTIPTGALETVVGLVGANMAVAPLAEIKGRQAIVAVTSREGQPTLEAALHSVGFQPDTLPTVAGATVDGTCEVNQQERAALSKELQETKNLLERLGAEVGPVLAQIGSTASRERRLLEAEQNFPRTERAVLLRGWVAAADRAAVEGRLRELTRGRCVIAANSADEVPETEVPVLLRHAGWLRPFSLLVRAYGLPSYRELEPTVFVALSYVVMFGMMFGDLGHGAVLAVAGLVLLGACRSGEARDAGLLLGFAGGSSMVFGTIYGSFFGLHWFKRYALWHDPLEGDPMALMQAAMGLGIVMISLGLGLNIVNRFRRGDLLGGFLDKFGVIGLIFYWGLLALLTQTQTFRAHGLVSLALVIFVGLPIIGWSLYGPVARLCHRRLHSSEGQGGVWVALAESLVGAFEAVLSYLANTISFVRLAAYAMSHAALLMAAFLMAAEVKGLPAAGDALSVVVIILGNLLALLLEGIIASVQALRLEYYEFFGKFFSGTGQPFTPFRLEEEGQGAA